MHILTKYELWPMQADSNPLMSNRFFLCLCFFCFLIAYLSHCGLLCKYVFMGFVYSASRPNDFQKVYVL